MFYDSRENKHGLKHDPYKALVSPRPIGWISTVGSDGVVNLAPYSFFNALSDSPHYVYFSSAGRKDSQRNAEDTGEFVCSLATWNLRDQMNVTSAGVAPEVDEFVLAGLTPAPSKLVAPPRVAESPVAFECKYYQSLELPRDTGRNDYTVVIGRVVGIHIDDDVIVEGMVDMGKLRPIARLGYKDYTVVDTIFSLDRPQ